MSTEQLLKDSVSFSMSINNPKLSSLFRDGNLHFSEEQLKRNFPLISSFPTESNLIQTVSTPSNGSLFSNLNHINGIRSNLAHFNGLMNQSISLYGPPGVVGCPTMNPYFLESMEHLQHLAAAQKSPINSRVLHVPNHSENFMDMNSHPRRKNATRETTSILKAWLNEHKKNPYPTKGEKIMLAVITKMTLTQVSTWFANARRRLKKENKMTWSPNHKSDDEADDLDDTDSSDIPIRLQDDPTILTKSYSKELQNEFLSKLSNINNLPTTTTTTNEVSNSNLSSDLSKAIKPKIWSIADITSDNNEKIIDKSSSNSIVSLQDNSCPIFSTQSLTNMPTQNPALQFLLWKHRDIYQNPLPSLFSKSSRLSFDFNNSKNKIVPDSNQTKKSE